MTQIRRHAILRLTLVAFSALLLLIAIEGCSKLDSYHYEQGEKTHSTKQKTGKEDPAVLELSRLQTLTELMPKLGRYRAVLIGETHTDYGDHLNQLAIIEGLNSRLTQGGFQKLAVGLEMVQQPYQRYLDDYVAGRISEIDMLRGVQWYQRWRYDYRLYRPIFHYAKQHKIPLIALNIPREMTRRISEAGFAGLDAEARRLLPEKIEPANPAYRQRLKNVYGMHASTRSGNFERFLEAQLAWDEGMAYRAARYLKNHPATQLVIIAGSGHVIREAMPTRLEKQIKDRTAVVLSHGYLGKGSELPKSSEADFLLFAPHKQLPPVGKIGIAMLDKPEGVLIEAVLPKRAAARAGLIKGDLILMLDKLTVKSSEDVRLWALDKEPGDNVIIKVLRNGNPRVLPITLDGAPALKHAGFQHPSR